MKKANIVFFLAILILSLNQDSFAQSYKKIALVIGNTHYTNIKQPKLKNPKNDAISVAQHLQDLGFEIIRPVNKKQGAQLDLTKRELIRAKAIFKQEAHNANIALLYYAGHGMQFKENESAYILPVDVEAPPTPDANEVDYRVKIQLMEKDSLSLTQWIDELKLQTMPDKVKLTIAIYDACREIPGATRSIFGSGSGAFRGIVRNKTINSPRHFDLIAYSAEEGKYAADGAGHHSPYTQELINGLKNESSREVYDFFRNIQHRVQQRIQQAPVLSPANIPNDTFFLAQSSVNKQFDPLPSPEWQLWQALIENCTDISCIKVYLKKYPNGQFVKKALARILDFQKQPVKTLPLRKLFEPEMVNIPSGSFQMGCVSGKDCDSNEKPLRQINIPAFYMSKTEITFDQWDACVSDKGCSHEPDDENWGKGLHPVINVSWDDAQMYVKWLTKKTGRYYRLPSEAEWEFAARAGTTSKFSWGNQDPSCSKTANNGANHYGGNRSKCYQPNNKLRGRTELVASYKANDWDLYDMHGNVWEWVQDCYHDNYNNAPSDGSAWEKNCYTENDSTPLTLRGGSWDYRAERMRSAYRLRGDRDWRFNDIGFRIARTN
jgi:formylglycine-generating enzyme required for sulfatase activity